MAYHDLFIKWKSDKKENQRLGKIHEILEDSEYTYQALNYSLHRAPYPFGVNSANLVRLTIKSDFNQLLNDTESLSKFDLISARPKSEADFHYCCMNAELDVISLKLHERLLFKIKLNLVQEAIKRGIMFEICYSNSLKDMNARRIFIANASNLIKATKARNIIMSSAAKDFFEQRAPWDVINLACVLGLPIDAAHKSVVDNPAIALEHAKSRKVFKSVIQVVPKEEFLHHHSHDPMQIV